MRREAILSGVGCVAALITAASLYTSVQIKTTAAVVRRSDDGGNEGEGKHDPNVKVTPIKSLYRGNILAVTAEAVAGGLHIHGEAEVVDTEAAANYVWMVRILPAEGHQLGEYGDPAFEAIYHNQMFQVAPDQMANPKFDDLIAPAPVLGAGKFSIELDLVRMAPGVTRDSFQDNEHFWSHAIAGGSRLLVVK